ncbi:flippase [Lactobacillus crispatus]|uniref:flippase n=1 Tax=Lactobacillus crispatus TaxID=47770 RepID=UPI00123C7992|nr:flippase [Lactobacillus crispatus]KAA8808142.1 flippase [Lactobacillus crispatus]
MKRSSLGLNAFLNGLRSLLNLLFPLITFPYVSRVLSVDGMGKYNFANTYIKYFLLIAALGINTYAIREGASFRDNKKLISRFVSQIFTINIYSTLIAYLLLILSLIIFGSLHNYISTILIFSLQMIFTTIGVEWVFNIYEKYTYITVRSIIFKIISVILLFLIVRKPNDYLWYAGITVFATVGSNLLNFIYVKSFCNIKLVLHTKLRKHLKPILILFATAAAVNIYVSSDVTVLGIIKNDYDVGIYTIAVSIYGITTDLMSAIITVTIPRLANLIGNGKKKEYNKILMELINTLSLITLPAMVGLIMLSKEIILIIAGKHYLPAVSSLQIICFAMFFSLFSFVFNQCVLIPTKREKIALRNTVLTAILNIVLNLLFIPALSYNGTSLSTVISQVVVMVLNGWAGKDIIGKILFSQKVYRNLFSSFLGCLGIIGICLMCKVLFTSLIVKTIVSIIFSVFIYTLILILCKNELAIKVLRRLQNFIC